MCSPLFFLLWFKITPKLLKNTFLYQIYFSVVSVKFSQSTILFIIAYTFTKSYTQNRSHNLPPMTSIAYSDNEKGTFFRMSHKIMNYFLNPSFSISARYLSMSVFFRYARSPLLCPTILRSPLLEW